MQRLTWLLCAMAAILTTTTNAAAPPGGETREVLEGVLRSLGFSVPSTAPAVTPGVQVVAARQDYARPTPGRCCHTLTPLRVGDRTFSHGVGAHANGLISLVFQRPFRRFHAWVGVDNNSDTGGTRGTVVFTIRTDGRDRWRSQVCRGGQPPVEARVDLTGTRRLDLLIGDAGDGYSFDQADWGEAVLEDAKGRVVTLEELIAGTLPSPFFEARPTTFDLDATDCWQVFKQWGKPDEGSPTRGARGGARRSLTWRSKQGLGATLNATLYDDPPALELGWNLTNKGKTESGLVTHLRSLRLEGPAGKGRWRLVSCTGGLTGAFHNTREAVGFHLRETILGRRELEVRGGRSSQGDLPFFLVRDDTSEWGVAVGLGWSGQWRATAWVDDQRQRGRVELGLEPAHFRLPPGRSIRLPRVLLVPFRGSLEKGSNSLRRVLRTRIQPLLNGKPVLPPVSFNSWFVFHNGVSEDLLRDLADRAAPLGIEYFCLDAGWFDGDFPNGVGNWTVNRAKFPHGLKPVADYVHAKGMKFGLWFEPERVSPGARWSREHGDLLLGGRLLDLSRPEARRLVLDMLDRFISEVGVDWIRYDFNTNPLRAWQSAEDADHQGLRQIEYVNGLYDLWAELRRKHPGLLIEQCSSGGRRLDLETIRNGHTFWKSDNTGDVALLRFHETGGNFFLPGGLLNTNLLRFRSASETLTLFAGPLGFGLDFRRLSAEETTELKQIILAYKQVRSWIDADYYALFRQTTDEEAWTGWQFIDPHTQRGFFVVYRPALSRYAAAEVRLRGLAPNATYQLRDALSGQIETAPGKLLGDGWRVELAKDAARVVEFERTLRPAVSAPGP